MFGSKGKPERIFLDFNDFRWTYIRRFVRDVKIDFNGKKTLRDLQVKKIYVSGKMFLREIFRD